MLKYLGILFGLVVVVTIGLAVGLYIYLSPAEAPLKFASPSSVRALTSGEIVGYQSPNGTHAWLGVPYAAPPVDELRWKAPRPVRTWQDRRETLEYGATCPQLPAIPGSDEGRGYVGEEDCLVLNVWAPPYHPEGVPAGDEAMPVMFWIHGGGNTIGSGGSSRTEIYDGALMAKEHDVIVVTINYRMGPMGWFYHDALNATSATPEDASGNYGTLDIIAALQWVQNNIAVFGGNPGNVTIYGESAGGFNVLSLMASPVAEGLFHRAIVQSGALRIATRDEARNPSKNHRGQDVMTSKEMVAQWLLRADKAPGKTSAVVMQSDMDPAELSDWLRSLPVAEVFSIFDPSFAGMIEMPLLIGDGHVLPEKTAMEIFSDPENYANVPLMIGSNRDEVALFMAFQPEYVEFTSGLPTNIKDIDAYRRDVKYGTDFWRADGVDSIAEAISRNNPDSVFVYRFDADDWRNLGVIDFKELFGAAHALELFFVFGYFPEPMKILFPDSTFDEIQLLSSAMMSYWAEFARNGDPGAGANGEEPLWLPWSQAGNSGQFMVLDTEIDKGIRMEQGVLTTEGVREAFLAESFSSLEEQCRSYRNVFFNYGYDQAEYESLGCN